MANTGIQPEWLLIALPKANQPRYTWPLTWSSPDLTGHVVMTTESVAPNFGSVASVGAKNSLFSILNHCWVYDTVPSTMPRTLVRQLVTALKYCRRMYYHTFYDSMLLAEIQFLLAFQLVFVSITFVIPWWYSCSIALNANETLEKYTSTHRRVKLANISKYVKP